MGGLAARGDALVGQRQIETESEGRFSLAKERNSRSSRVLVLWGVLVSGAPSFATGFLDGDRSTGVSLATATMIGLLGVVAGRAT